MESTGRILGDQVISRRDYHERPYVEEKRYDDQTVSSRGESYPKNPYAVGTIHSPQRSEIRSGSDSVSRLESILKGVGLGIVGAAAIAGASWYFIQNSRVTAEEARAVPLNSIEEISAIYKQYNPNQIKLVGSALYVDKNANGNFRDKSDLVYVLSPELSGKRF